MKSFFIDEQKSCAVASLAEEMNGYITSQGSREELLKEKGTINKDLYFIWEAGAQESRNSNECHTNGEDDFRIRVVV